MSDADQFADTIEEIMMFIAIAKRAGRNGVDRMDGAVPYLPEATGIARGLTGNEWPDDQWAKGAGSAQDNIANAYRFGPPPGAWVFKALRPLVPADCGDFQFACELARVVTPRECRGLGAVYPVMLKTDLFFLDKTARPTPTKSHFSGWTGSRWKYVGKHYARIMAELEREAGIASMLVDGEDERWHVKLAYEDSPSIKFSCSPTGAAEVFRLRDIPDGKSRRAALRNWVSAHYRKPIDDRNALIEVRKHLRGQTKFSWSGLRCEIVPAAADLRAVLEGTA